jgi:hypothetical protein
MKRFILAYILLTLLLILLCSGCASSAAVQYTYSAVNTGTTIASQKSLPDHALTAVTGGDCNLFNIFKGLYYCEMPTYNRTGF